MPSIYSGKVMVYMFNGGRQEAIFTYLNVTLEAGQSFQWGGDEATPLIQLRVSIIQREG